MPEKKPKAAVSTPDEPLVQADWDEARRVRPHEFLPAPCVLNTNAAKEAEDHHKQVPPTSELADSQAGTSGTQPTAAEKDAMRANAPETPNAPRQPKPSDRAGSEEGRLKEPASSSTGAGDRRSDAEVVQQEGLRAPREEAVKHEVKG